MSVLAVTGATGRLGRRVAERLAAQGIPLRLLVRDASRAPDLPGCEVAVASYRDADAARAALDGVRTLFTVSGAEEPDRVAQHRTFVDAAAAAGVGHVVYTSFFGAAPDCTFLLGRDHWHTEQHLRASGLAWTFLRDNLYLDMLPLFVGEDGAIRGPAGDGRLAGVAIDDVADAAVAVLREPHVHAGSTYDLTGPEALTLAEAAATITAETGRAVRFVDETIPEAYASRAVYDAPAWMVDGWVSTYTAIARGELAAVTADVQHLTGHPATSLAELLRRNAIG